MSLLRARVFALGALLALAVAGCGGYGSPMNGALPPAISQLNPNAIAHGSLNFNMTVTGNYFGADSVVYFNGNPLQTAFVNAMQVTAQVPAAAVANAGMVQVYVRTGGQNSNNMTFTIQ